MALPDFPEIDRARLEAIAARHGLGGRDFVQLPQVGTFNVIFGVGDDFILRVPRDHPRFTGATRNEAIAVPLARAAGVATPAIVAFDDRQDILPVPYAIYERAPGENFERAVADPARYPGTWRALGRDLARLHACADPTAGAALQTWPAKTDPRPLPDEIARVGYFTRMEADWLNEWLERLAPHALVETPQWFLHGDTQSANMIVAPGTMDYRAVIDWGSCEVGDVAVDFSGIPLRAVPAMLDGYRDIAGDQDETLEARILWHHLKIALHQLRGTPKPDWSWGERPLGMPLEILRFFAGTPGARWRQWAPGA